MQTTPLSRWSWYFAPKSSESYDRLLENQGVRTFDLRFGIDLDLAIEAISGALNL
jgi:hypothetical protein